MTEVIAFIAGAIVGSIATVFYAGLFKQWLLSKLKKDEPRPVMGGPIQPDEDKPKDR